MRGAEPITTVAIGIDLDLVPTDAFFTTRGYDGWPLVMLRLDAVDVDRRAELVLDSWRMRAPAEIAGLR
jgi:hypothetical protein